MRNMKHWVSRERAPAGSIRHRQTADRRSCIPSQPNQAYALRDRVRETVYHLRLRWEAGPSAYCAPPFTFGCQVNAQEHSKTSQPAWVTTAKLMDGRLYQPINANPDLMSLSDRIGKIDKHRRPTDLKGMPRQILVMPASNPEKNRKEVSDFLNSKDPWLIAAQRKYYYVEGIRDALRGVMPRQQCLAELLRLAREIEDSSPPSYTSLWRWTRRCKRENWSPWALIKSKKKGRKNTPMKFEKPLDFNCHTGEMQNQVLTQALAAMDTHAHSGVHHWCVETTPLDVLVVDAAGKPLGTALYLQTISDVQSRRIIAQRFMPTGAKSDATISPRMPPGVTNPDANAQEDIEI